MTEEAFDYKIIGQSPEMRSIRELVAQVAKKNVTVLLRGESGTGKELLARVIHQHSLRKEHPFIAVNCAAVPLDLLESELFGHERGAFTGAINSRSGRFALADGGTLFLDEIGDMPLPMQAKFLRVLQERVFERLGGEKIYKTDVRIIAATHRNLPVCIQEGTFREDLYYRLNVFPIELPPLRKHLDDLKELIQHIVGVQSQLRFKEEALLCMKEYHWPGNVRELINCVERLKVLHADQCIEKSMLPKEIQLNLKNLSASINADANTNASASAGIYTNASANANANLSMNNGNAHMNSNLSMNGNLNTENEEFPINFDLKEHLAKVEVELIQKALTQNKGIVARAAKQLGLRRTTLVEKLRKYGLVREYNTSS